MSEEQTPVEPVSTEQTPVQPDASASILNDDGGFSETYLSGLSEDLGQHSIFQKYKTAEEFFKGAINSQKLNGQRAEDFWNSEDPDVVSVKHRLMDVPSDKSEYKYSLDGLPEHIPQEAVKEDLDAFIEYASENKWPKAYAEQAAQWYIDQTSKAVKTMGEQETAAFEASETALREEWKGDAYEENIEKANRVGAHLELGELMDEFPNNTTLIKALVEKIAPLIDNDTIIEARQNQSIATIGEQHNSIMDQILSFEGDMSTEEYQKLLRRKAEIESNMK